MPIISRFFGIVIYMYWKDHAPPHFHAKYGDDEIVVEIRTGNVSGSMSNRAIKLIQEWRQLHEDELLEDWKLAELKKALFAINPLE
ncbi:MAG: transcriptional regulator [Planctomycetota bacterium]|nr:MAG: transcriptional regulator [Planctomycetota bacterium]